MSGARLESLVTAQARLTPDKAAIVMDDATISYKELEQRSNQLASMLIAAGVRHGDRLCMLLPKSIDAILCMLASLKVGGVYVPVDLASPANRSQKIIDACEPSVLFVSAESKKVLQSLQPHSG